jgi:hypothetical protein
MRFHLDEAGRTVSTRPDLLLEYAVDRRRRFEKKGRQRFLGVQYRGGQGKNEAGQKGGGENSHRRIMMAGLNIKIKETRDRTLRKCLMDNFGEAYIFGF